MLPDPRPYFTDLTDPRRATKNKLHALEDILMIVLCSVLSGIEDWVGMEEFAQEKEGWFRSFLKLENGIPSHDTLSTVIGRLKPKEFNDCFVAWVQVALPKLGGQQVCIDGKALRGSRRGSERAVHLVSAFAAEARLVLGQTAVDKKSNEITAIPEILSMLDLTGALVSLDAMGTQKTIAKQVVEAGADYLLALKENHPDLSDDVSLWLDDQAHNLEAEEVTEKDHGRLETRKYILSDKIDWLDQKDGWVGLKAVGRVESTRIINGKESTERRYFLCSFNQLERFAKAARKHWAIENQQHWVLDVQFSEDANQAHKDHSPQNLAIIRRMSLNIIKANDPSNKSIKRRKLKAVLNDQYRMQLLTGHSKAGKQPNGPSVDQIM